MLLKMTLSLLLNCTANLTTNSSKGVTNINEVFNILEIMNDNNIPLLIHGEVNDRKVDILIEKKYLWKIN